MILYELLGKPPYMPKKAKPQKSPVPPQKKSEDIPGTGAALDRVRSQLRRDALKVKTKEPIVKESQPSKNHMKPISPEEKKTADKIKQIEEVQKLHESKRK
jgi:hypothetical protein